MATNEVNGDGKDQNPGGVYRHPDTGQELVTQATSKFGNPQADAIVRLGFQYVGPANPNKVQPAADPSAAPLANTDPTQKSVPELEAELQAAKDRQKSIDKASNDKSDLVDRSEPKPTVTSPTAATPVKGAK